MGGSYYGATRREFDSLPWCVLMLEVYTAFETIAVLQVELMRRKQHLQHLDQRQLLMLENAYYQVLSLIAVILKPSADQATKVQPAGTHAEERERANTDGALHSPSHPGRPIEEDNRQGAETHPQTGLE